MSRNFVDEMLRTRIDLKRITRRVFCSLGQHIYTWTAKIILKRNGNTSVYMFHQVVERNDNNDEFAITTDEFAFFLKEVQRKSRIISVDDLVGEKFDSTEQVSVFTFDDIYENAVENAVCEMNRRKLPCCLFVAGDLINKKGYVSRRSLDWCIQNRNCTIGAHTLSHGILSFMSRSEAAAEMDPQRLQSYIGRKVSCMAYPYGSMYACDRKCVEFAEKAGYQCAFSTLAFRFNKEYMRKHRFYLPRINVNSDNYERLLKELP